MSVEALFDRADINNLTKIYEERKEMLEPIERLKLRTITSIKALKIIDDEVSDYIDNIGKHVYPSQCLGFDNKFSLNILQLHAQTCGLVEAYAIMTGIEYLEADKLLNDAIVDEG